jgi:hypothetical protein
MRMPRVLVLVALAGCSLDPKIRPAASSALPEQRQLLWGASLAELQSLGFELERAEPARWEIATQQTIMDGEVPCGLLRCRFRDRVTIAVDAGGAVGVRIERETSNAAITYATSGVLFGALFGPSWSPVVSTQKATVAGVVRDQVELLRAIHRRAGLPLPPPVDAPDRGPADPAPPGDPAPARPAARPATTSASTS